MLSPLLGILTWLVVCHGQRIDYYMDQLSDCGQKIRVESTDITITGRSKVAPTNPPRECVIMLESSYTNSKSQLRVVVESLHISDCSISLELFDSPSPSGSTLRRFGCSSKSTDTVYSASRYVTIRLKRTKELFQINNDFTLRVRAYEDPDKKGVSVGGLKIPVGGIIGIILALLSLIVFALLLAWCYKSGKIPGLEFKKYEEEEKARSLSRASSRDTVLGSENPGMAGSISRRQANNVHASPAKPVFEGMAFNAITGIESRGPPPPPPPDMSRQRQYSRSDSQGYPNSEGERQYRYQKRQDSVRNSANLDRKDENNYDKERNQRRDSDSKPGKVGYAQIVFSEKQLLERKASLRSTKKDDMSGDDNKGYSDGTSVDDETASQSTDAGVYDVNSRRAKRWARNKPKEEGKNNTLPPSYEASLSIDNNRDGVTDTAEIQKSPTERVVPEMFEDNLDDQLYSSIDQVSDPLLAETMDNPVQKDGKLRNSVTENSELLKEDGTPSAKRRSKRSHSPKKRDKSPSKDAVPDTYILPEANEPVFTTDTSSVISAPLQPYDNNPYSGYTAPGAAGVMPMQMFNGFMAPYGYNPQPGTQTMVYAYQHGAPADPNGYQDPNAVNQAGIFVQSNSPSVNQAAFMMKTTKQDPNRGSKRKGKSPKSTRKHQQQPQGDPYHPGMPNYTSTPGNMNIPYQNTMPMAPYEPSVHGHTPEDQMALAPINVAKAAIPPSVYSVPHSPHRTAVMKTKVDPHSGVQSTQVQWTDSAPDPTDPVGPDANPKITRKTVTRVTTKGGHGELPPHGNIFEAIDAQSSDPEFLSPTSSQLAIDASPARNPAYIAVDPHANRSFYSGVPSANQPVIHNAPVQSRAIKDSISIA